MVKKGVKRPLEGSNAAPKIQERQQEQSTKNKKFKSSAKAANNVPPQKRKNEKKITNQLPAEQIKNQNIAIESEAKSKEWKKMKKQRSKPTGEDQKTKILNVVEKRVAAQKKKKEKQQKAKENGQSKVDNIVSLEAIKARMESICSRDVISRTARRRLAALNKKLRIAEGTYSPDVAKEPKLSKNLKRKLRRHKNALERSDTEGEIGHISMAQKQAGLEEKAKAVGILVEQERAKQLIETKPPKENKNSQAKQDKQQKSQQENKAVKADAKSSCDDDEDDEIDDDSDQDDSQVAASILNTSQEDDGDSEEDEAEEEDDDSAIDSKDEEEIKPQSHQEQAKIQSGQAKKTTKTNNPGKPEEQKQNAEKKTRYVLFVGNISYAATPNELRQHFLTKVSAVSSVRIPNNKDTSKPKGFGYVEFTNSEDYEKGLSLHQSVFQGRKINVQYTSGGAKGSGKKTEIIAKNKKLHAMRKEGKLAGSVKESNKRSIRRKKQKTQTV